MVSIDDPKMTKAISKTALLCLAMTSFAHASWTSDACSTRSVESHAEVTVSDGSSFTTRSYFNARDAAAIQHISETEQLVAVEGPLGWTRSGDDSGLGADFHKSFALGHQFHAMLLYFEEIVTDARSIEAVRFHDAMHPAIGGEYPYGGDVMLVDGDSTKRPAGLVFEFPDTAPITATFLDWREQGDLALPYHIRIDDGQRVFDYRYTKIDHAAKTPTWFFDVVPTPPLAEVEIHRLHRKLLAAHCLGDADLIASLTSPEVVIASRGELLKVPNSAVHEQFVGLFERVDYTEYHDIAPPIIEVAEASDLGWIGVNVRAVGSDKDTGDSFDSQWAWVMMVEKTGDRWLHSGNASNRTQ